MEFSGFHPELFEHKASAMERLESAGFTWLSDFTAIDLLHQDYRIEVCGIREERAANEIAELLSGLFRDWRYGCISYQDRDRDPGWKVEICKRRRKGGDSQKASGAG